MYKIQVIESPLFGQRSEAVYKKTSDELCSHAHSAIIDSILDNSPTFAAFEDEIYTIDL